MENLAWEIAETAHALRRSYDRRAAELGVTRAQWRVLAWLSREPGLRQIDLADKLDVEAITLCRIIDRLEEAGLVERQPDPEDRRAWRLRVTEKAKPVVEDLKRLATELAQTAFAGLGEGGTEEMRASLKRIRGNLCAAMTKSKQVSA
jgi:MarR family transcriptional regulator for hemolysin